LNTLNTHVMHNTIYNMHYHLSTPYPTRTSRVAQLCYIVMRDKPFLWSKPKFDPP